MQQMSNRGVTCPNHNHSMQHHHDGKEHSGRHENMDNRLMGMSRDECMHMMHMHQHKRFGYTGQLLYPAAGLYFLPPHLAMQKASNSYDDNY